MGLETICAFAWPKSYHHVFVPFSGLENNVMLNFFGVKELELVVSIHGLGYKQGLGCREVAVHEM